MMRWANGAILGAAALVTASAASADVKAGVDAWSRGDYAAAVHEWQGPATVGDADAMFNLAQAYRLGRGVPRDPSKAEALYAQAAAKGHLQAADTYGLMLFQDGRREAALPYIEDAARRGDPRSEYLLGIAHFNGDLVGKDWVKAYALVSMANAQGLPQAAPALAQMDEHVPLAQRQQAAGLAIAMQQQADAARGRELAAADLGAGPSAAASGPAAAGSVVAARSPQTRAPANVAVSPSLSAALAALDQAREATGTESPAEAGASYSRHAPVPTRLATAVPSRPAPTAVAAAGRSAPAVPVAKAAPPPATPAAKGGAWRVQLGAFSVRGNVDKLWAQVDGRAELAGKRKLAVPAGAVTKLQAGGFATRDDAEDACRSLKHSGHDCIVTR